MAPNAKISAAAALLLFTVLVASGGGASAIHAAGAAPAPPAPLAARLHATFGDIDGAAILQAPDGDGQGGGGWMDCWSAVAELRSCTNEIVLFFLNGESYLGRDCCVAIRTVTRHCWPSMLTFIGFTAQEADILRGFCDAEVALAPPAAPLAPPAAPAPAPASASVQQGAKD